ncbi:50S ribosomal protein L11 methyltransferase [Pedobacter sp. KR3-3]|uniref:Ribosomal protein L11 methyltransferase n=1 Tax=Pedobacter albus TaxID=3113905 RepID=A0ABU7I364_9SPHI|nr:50S ribosomal protein L11 methyltransferase [Pedobacter sp. KR3-3]MEE1943905.1 50S ribosomal protein L11 methyltransferase [Pedobacter sp. KR3-3]
MDYKQVAFQFGQIEEYQKDLLVGALGEIGFDTFEDNDKGFDAFILANQFNEIELNEVLASFGDELQYTYLVSDIEAQNWNEEWEKNFSPLIITDNCYVRATFHEAQPQYEYEIVIDPKMAFGTGHHQTTTMMMQYILETDVEDKTVLDMGAGTGILGILASKRGAKQLVAIDNDEVCHRSTIENAELNEVSNLASFCGSKEAIPATQFDIILANINRNILLDQIESYDKVLREKGLIFFSGFYESPDLDMIKAHCAGFDLVYLNHKKLGDWVAAQFVKK